MLYEGEAVNIIRKYVYFFFDSSEGSTRIEEFIGSKDNDS